jgi:[ribosomal protein S18]-alanine N-acetyltransferase
VGDNIIREATQEDILYIYNIEKACFEKPWAYSMFEEEITDNDKARYFVIEYNSEIVGYSGYWKILEESHIMNIAIKPGHQGKGLGRLLLEYMIGAFEAEKVERATLEVGVGNNKAISLYLSAGFMIKGIRKKYYNGREDAYIMWKEMGVKNDKA